MQQASYVIDAHCHLADPRLDKRRESLLRQAAACRIGGFIQGGVDPEDWRRQLRMADSDWYLTFGLHPWFVANNNRDRCRNALDQLPEFLSPATASKTARSRKPVALGETGLDFFSKQPSASFPRQREFFEAQLVLAQELDYPLVLHLVACHDEAPAMLKRVAPKWRGLVHGFTGSLEVARTYLDMGLTLSIGGAVARPGYKKLKKALADLSPQDYVVESDAPDQAPTPHRGVINEPGMLWITAAAIGAIRGESAATVLAQSTTNLQRIFDLEPSP